MKSLSLKKEFVLIFIVLFVSNTPLFGGTVQTYTDLPSFEAALLHIVTTITFEGIAQGGGQANAVNLIGNEFPGITLTPGPGADGLFVGIPDITISSNDRINFVAHDFFPTSGVAVFSPDLCAVATPPPPPPIGALIVDFHTPRTGIGAYFLDVEGGVSSIEAFDGPAGTGNSIAKVTLQNKGDNSQAFAGIVATDGIKSAVLVMGSGSDGVGMDDLCYGPIPEPATLLLFGFGSVALLRKRRA